MNEPAWLVVARSDIGIREIPGAPTEPRIAGWLKKLGALWSDDATPWCGTACAAWMAAAGMPIPKHWYRARAWLDWGETLAAPALGCVVIYARTGGGHVGLVVGANKFGHLMTLGGNQGDAVSIRPFEMSRVLGYRWPAGAADRPGGRSLPQFLSNGSVSTNEA
jgi:uncharacterized protein (TIGR02594 family)